MAIDSEPSNNSQATPDMLGLVSGTTPGASLNRILLNSVQSVTTGTLDGLKATAKTVDPVDYVAMTIGSDVKTMRLSVGLIPTLNIDAAGVVGAVAHIEYAPFGVLGGQAVVIEARVGYSRHKTQWEGLSAQGVSLSLSMAGWGDNALVKADYNRLLQIDALAHQMEEPKANVSAAQADVIANQIRAIVAQGGSSTYAYDVNQIGLAMANIIDNWHDVQYTLNGNVVSLTSLSSVIWNASGGGIGGVSVKGYSATLKAPTTGLAYTVTPLVLSPELSIASFTNGVVPQLGTSNPDDLFAPSLTDGIIAYGYGGDDNLSGSWWGNDVLDGGDNNDRISPGWGNNVVRGGAGTDVMLMDGVRSIYRFNFDTATNELLVSYLPPPGTDDYAPSLNRVTGIESIAFYDMTVAVKEGTAKADKLNGTAVDDVLLGYGGNDTLNGLGGADFMAGGLGDDNYVVDNADDRVSEDAGQGKDTITTTVNVTLPDDVENLTAAKGALPPPGDYLELTGNDLPNTITGNEASNWIDGAGGADTMKGGAGDDRYLVDSASDVVVEAAKQGTDAILSFVPYTLPANVEGLTLLGMVDGDLIGNASDNTLIGSGGNNVLAGKAGNDLLWGTSGFDGFLFDTKLNAKTNVDHIVDFTPGDDIIELSTAIFSKAGPAGWLSAGVFYAGTAAQATTDRIVYDQGTGTLYYDADGSGKAAAVAFAILDNKAALTSFDILLV